MAPDAQSRSFDYASRSNRWISLVPVEPRHLDYLYELATHEETGARWRYHGSLPTRDAFIGALWAGVLAQFVVQDRKSGTPLGLVVAYNADHRNGFCYVAGVMAAPASRSGLGVAALDVFVNYLFHTWNFRKLYAEVPEYNLELLGGGRGPLLKVEGELCAHLYYGAKWWDLLIVAIYREDYAGNTRVSKLGDR
jgi:RimJ/RimL family protein N-acetyltransferase